MVRTQPFQGCNARFEPGADHQRRVAADNSLPTHAELISMWLGNIVLEKPGTKLGYSQVAKAPVFDTGTAGSNPAIPAMIRYSSGSRGQSAKLLAAGSNPARISTRCLRLIGQDTSLSSWQYGFESRRHHQRRVAADNSGTVAQLVERQTENLSVTGSIPVGSTIWVSRLAAMAADCKSAG